MFYQGDSIIKGEVGSIHSHFTPVTPTEEVSVLWPRAGKIAAFPSHAILRDFKNLLLLHQDDFSTIYRNAQRAET